MRKINVIFCFVFFLAVLPINVHGQIKVWSFTDELAYMINNFYNKTYPEIKVEYSQFYSEQFQNKIDPVLKNGQGAPDIIALESSFVRK